MSDSQKTNCNTCDGLEAEHKVFKEGSLAKREPNVRQPQKVTLCNFGTNQTIGNASLPTLKDMQKVWQECKTDIS